MSSCCVPAQPCHDPRISRRNRLALSDLDTALQIGDLPAVIEAPLRLDRAVLRGAQGDGDGEMSDYTQVIEMSGVSARSRLRAHLYRGIARIERGDRRGAIRDFVAVRDDADAPTEAKREATKRLDALDPLG